MRRPSMFAFPTLAGVLGVGYLAGDPVRTASSSFTVAKALAPLQVWAALFLTGAMVMLAAIAARSRPTMIVALMIGGAIYTWWAVLLLLAAFLDERASVNAWAAYGFIAAVHFYRAHQLRVHR